MSVTRRELFSRLRVGFIPDDGLPLNGLALAARGHEAESAETFRPSAIGEFGAGAQAGSAAPIKLSSNENPMGPGRAVLNAITGRFGETMRYPFNVTPGDAQLIETIAALHKAKPENVALGAGSQELLKVAVWGFTNPARHLVTATPTFENVTGTARRMGHPVVEVKVDGQFRLDLEGMLANARGAGLIFVNNPNNPTGTVHSGATISDFVERVRRISPDTVILIDEAYHEYVTDPAYESAVPLALQTPNVFVARTFSKAYGMAGMRIGYALGMRDTIRPLARLALPFNISVLGTIAAITALNDPAHMAAERDRNTQVRDFTQKALEDLGCRSTVSQTNFLFTNVGRSASAFRSACGAQGIQVGRDFPPFDGSHARISLGTMAEMQRAVAVFRNVLGSAATSGEEHARW
ncbi:MAG: histidinol-phosphate transaminase [Acidobacteria bacterium]|nr:histidinol-phosphate transaminase [Acidobacteriota bacterium]